MRFWSIRTTTSPFISQTQYNARGRVGTPMVRRRALPIRWPLLVSRTGVRRNRPSPAVNSDEVVRVGAGSSDVSPYTDHILAVAVASHIGNLDGVPHVASIRGR